MRIETIDSPIAWRVARETLEFVSVDLCAGLQRSSRSHASMTGPAAAHSTSRVLGCRDGLFRSFFLFLRSIVRWECKRGANFVQNGIFY